MSAARRSWVLRGVAKGVAEDSRTRGFASLACARFALSPNHYGIFEKSVNSGLCLAIKDIRTSGHTSGRSNALICLPADLETDTPHQPLRQLFAVNPRDVERGGNIQVDILEDGHAQACVGLFGAHEVLPVTKP